MRRTLLVSFAVLAAFALGALLLSTADVEPQRGTEPEAPASPQQGASTATTSAETLPPTEIDADALRARQPVAPASAHRDASQGVFGRVVDARGLGVAGAEVLLLESASNDPIQRFLSLAQGAPTVATASQRTDVDGSFRLGLPTVGHRRHEIYVTARDFAARRGGEVWLRRGEWLDLGSLAMDRGTLIRGRVTLAGTDLPVPEAIVRIESGDPFFDLGPAQLPGHRERNTAAADALGNYELACVPTRSVFRLLAAAPGFGRTVVDQVDTASAPVLRIDFALPRGLTISGRLDAGGGPMTGVHVEAFSKAAEPAFTGDVGSDGRFHVHGLREGPHLVRVAADGCQPVAIDNVAAGTADLVVTLLARGSASVAVYTSSGALLRTYRVAVRRYFSATDTLGAVRDVAERIVQLRSDESHARVDGLDVGTYAFQVEADGFASTLSPPFNIEQDQRSATVTMTMARGGTLRGRVVDPRGAAVADAEVDTQPAHTVDDNPLLRMVANLAPDRVTRSSTRTDAQGHFQFTRLAHGDYQLRVSHAAFCRTVRTGVEVRADDEAALLPIVLQPGTLVRGRALVDGQPRSQVLVVLTIDPTAAPEAGPQQKSRDDSSLVRVETVTNEDGSFELTQRIPPGNYELCGLVQLGGEAADPFAKFAQMKKSATPAVIRLGQPVAEFELRIVSAQ